MRLRQPDTLAAACALAREDPWDTMFVGGGTAVVLMMQQGLIAPSVLVSLARIRDIPGWTDIVEAPDDVRIGAGVTLNRVARSPSIRRHAPILAEAAAVVGNTRVRNVATLCGNVAEADYASDPPAVLVALDAMIEVSNGEDVRDIRARDIFIDHFTTALSPGEVIVAVRVPVRTPNMRSTYVKFRSRSAEDRPCVGVAGALYVRDGLVQSLELAVGAVAGTPQRFPDLTAEAVGHPLDPDLVERFADEHAHRITPLDDARGSAWYRQQIIRVLVRRSLQHIAADSRGDHG